MGIGEWMVSGLQVDARGSSEKVIICRRSSMVTGEGGGLRVQGGGSIVSVEKVTCEYNTW